MNSIEYPNPKLKVGDKIILKKGNNGQAYLEGKTLTVSHVRDGGLTYVVKDGFRTANIYQGSIPDVWVLDTRKARIENIKDEIKELTSKLESKKKELENLERFEDDEEETAYKLKKLMDNKNSVSAMADILRELKKTDYL